MLTNEDKKALDDILKTCILALHGSPVIMSWVEDEEEGMIHYMFELSNLYVLDAKLTYVKDGFGLRITGTSITV